MNNSAAEHLQYQKQRSVPEVLLIGFAFLIFLLASACERDVPEPESVNLEPIYNASGELCGRGIAVVESDYISTNLSVYDFDGKTAAARLFSSASAPAGLNAPLSGDVVLPTSLQADDFVVIDRGQSVLSRLSLKSGRVEAQINVGDGFFANPQDYLRVTSGPLVTRFEANPKLEVEALNQGDDLVLIDWQQAAVLESIRPMLSGNEPLSPDRVLRVADQLWVSSLGFSPGFADAADARWFVLNAESLALEQDIKVPGLRNCKGLAVSPYQERVAISCTGLFADANARDPVESALLIFEQKEDAQWQETQRVTASSLGSGPFGFQLEFAQEQVVIATTFGAIEGEDAGRPDRIVQWSLEAENVEFIGSPRKAFSLSSPSCSAACALCFIADATSSQVLRFAVTTDGLKALDAFELASGLGLPPRQLRVF